jgi:hypothetical protein
MDIGSSKRLVVSLYILKKANVSSAMERKYLNLVDL